MCIGSCHGVFIGIHLGDALFNIRIEIHLGIVGNHTLIHAVESKALTVRTPEGSLFYAELVTMDALAIDNLPATIFGNLTLLSITISHIQLITLDVGRSP